MKSMLLLAVAASVAYFGWQRHVSDGGAKVTERHGAKVVVAQVTDGTAE